MQGLDLLLLIDSSAAEGVLVKAYGGNGLPTTVAGAFWQQVGIIDVAAWIAHVPSRANLADALSRGGYEPPFGLEWARVEAVVPSRGRWGIICTRCNSAGDHVERPMQRVTALQFCFQAE